MSDHSDSEYEFSGDDSQVTWETAKRFKLRFGKLSGKRLGYAVRTAKNRDILRYYLSWSDLREESRVNIQCALDHYDQRKQQASKKRKRANVQPEEKKKKKKKKAEPAM